VQTFPDAVRALRDVGLTGTLIVHLEVLVGAVAKQPERPGSEVGERRDELLGRRVRRRPSSEIEPYVAAAIMGERLGVAPARAGARAVRPTDADREAAGRVFPAAGMRGLNRFADQYCDTDDPPLFCSFVRLDCTGESLRLRCFGVTGRAEDEADPPVEDETEIDLARA
jgi:hypothetical protein